MSGTVRAFSVSPPTVSVSATTGTATEGGQPGVFTLTSSSGSPTVYFQVTGTGSDPNFDDSLTYGSGQAITLSGPDSNGNFSGSVSNFSGSPTVTVNVLPGDDSDSTTGTEGVKLTVIDPPGAGCCCGGASYTPGSPSSDTVTINDEDVSLQGPSGNASEGSPATSQSFTVSRTGDPTNAVTVQLSTAGSTAVPGVDYSYTAATADYVTTSNTSSPVSATASLSGTGGSVTIPAGYSTVAITITPLDPTDSPGGPTGKTVQLQIAGGGCCSGTGPGYGVDSPSSATLTIDDPDGGTPVVSLAASPATSAEDVQNGAFTVTRNGDDGSLTVPFTLGGTAVEGTDYTLNATGGATVSSGPGGGSITFSDGVQPSATLSVVPVGEVGNKTATLTLTPASGGGCGCGGSAYTIGSAGTATVTIADAPLAASGVDVSGTAGTAVTGEVATFTDGDPSGSLSDYTAQITWGDGQTSSGTITADPNTPGQFDVAGTNTYASPGEFTGSVSIVDAGVAILTPFLGVIGPTTPLPNVTIASAYYPDNVPDKVAFTYSITGTVPSFRASLYYSKTGFFNSATDKLLASQIVTTGGPYPATGTFQRATTFQPDPNRPYLVVVADPDNAIPESNEADNTSNNVALPTLSVSTDKSVYTLMDVSTFTVTTNVAGGSFGVEGRLGSNPWVSLGTGSPLNFTERIAGQFTIRATETFGTIQFVSPAANYASFTVQFPNFSTIVSQGPVTTAANAAWQDTQSYAFNNSGGQDPVTKNYPNMKVREEAFWIYLDTATGTYSVGPTIYGNPTAVGMGIKAAQVVIGNRPADQTSPPTPSSPFGTAVYAVAALHTHPPMTYVDPPLRRPAGPSNPDTAFFNSQRVGVPGLVYDYDANPVLNRSQLAAPAHIYPVGPDRRGTP